MVKSMAVCTQDKQVVVTVPGHLAMNVMYLQRIGLCVAASLTAQSAASLDTGSIASDNVVSRSRQRTINKVGTGARAETTLATLKLRPAGDDLAAQLAGLALNTRERTVVLPRAQLVGAKHLPASRTRLIEEPSPVTASLGAVHLENALTPVRWVKATLTNGAGCRYRKPVSHERIVPNVSAP